MNYYDYGYPKNVPLIAKTCCGVDTEDIESAVTNAIMNIMPTINNSFGDVHTHIDEAKDDIMSVECGNCGGCENECGICLATKCDLNQAITKINEHIDSKFEEIDFIRQFGDLNEQIATFMN